MLAEEGTPPAAQPAQPSLRSSQGVATCFAMSAGV